MNYKVLYRKYRPDSFNSLVGQESVISILKNSIKENRIAHAYLFSGPRGTGKTSTARILAKSINCLNNHDGVACNKCDSCLSFNSNPDIIEIDAASNNGVDEIRELINNVKIMPTNLQYKVYIIDEVHMLSQSAFNALLLTLEEPPKHVVFILATTNIESVPITILSRCQRFDFKRINENDIIKQLEYVCKEESIEYTNDGLKEIAILSDGGLRDALSILDQISKSQEKITAELVGKEIGSISDSIIVDLLKSFNNNDFSKIESIFEEFEKSNVNYKVVVKKIIIKLSEVASKIINGTNEWQVDYDVCKKIVFELNDILNKINININPYLLIKMVFLNYLKPSKKQEKIIEKNVKVEEKKNEPKVIEAIEKLTENKQSVSDEKNNNFINIRVNNCFVKAKKNYLEDFKKIWEEFNALEENGKVKDYISDTLVVTASDNYAIIVTTIPHKETDANQNIKIIEESLEKSTNQKYKLVFVSEGFWQKEKEQYIKNIKNKYEYTYIEETEDDENLEIKDEIASVADIFDINKIEVE